MDIDWNEYSELIVQARNGENILSEEELRKGEERAKKDRIEERRIDKRLYARKYYHEHREEHIRQVSEYRKSLPKETIDKWRSNYAERNPDIVKKCRDNYCKNHKEELKKRRHEYYLRMKEQYPEKYLEKLEKDRIRRRKNHEENA